MITFWQEVLSSLVYPPSVHTLNWLSTLPYLNLCIVLMFADVWLAYIKMEMGHDKGTAASVSQLYWRAKKTLKPERIEAFTQQHTLLQNGHLDELEH